MEGQLVGLVKLVWHDSRHENGTGTGDQVKGRLSAQDYECGDIRVYEDLAIV